MGSAKSQEPPTANQPAPQEQQRPPQSEQEANAPQAPAKTPSITDFFSSDGLQTIAAYCSKNPDQKPLDWLHEKFICDVRSTDVLIAAFTGLLFIATALLTVATFALAWFVGRQEWWMRKHERAYVIAGPGYRDRKKIRGKKKENWPVIAILITAGNYGRTPAFLKKITVGLCPMTDGPLPPYPPFQTCEDVLYPNYSRKDVDVFFRLPISGNEDQICYGRIIYNDIFGREHWSSWKHKILANKNRNSIALEGSYSTGWDYDRKQKKTDPP